MRLDDYLNQLSVQGTGKLSNVKLQILKALWHGDDVFFPKPWVASSYLLTLTNQKYFDRRARELRSQQGCDIEAEIRTEFNGYAWRIKSPNLKSTQRREYLSLSQKNELFSKHNHTCSICGTQLESGLRGLQADHKMPLSREGTNEPRNWQALCCKCNVGKRRACENCIDSCRDCSWAFPEKVGINTIIRLSSNTLQHLEEHCNRHAIALKHYLNQSS